MRNQETKLIENNANSASGFIMFKAVVMALISALAFFTNRSIVNYDELYKDTYNDTSFIPLAVAQLKKLFNGTGFTAAVVFAAFIVLYRFFYVNYPQKDKRVRNCSVVMGVLLGACMLFGSSINANGNFDFIVYNICTIIFSCVLLFGYSYLFFCLSYIIADTVLKKREVSSDDYSEKNKALLFVLDKHSFTMPAVLLLVFWTPYLIAFFPGVVCWDGLRQLDFYNGTLEWTKFHPVASTWLIGIIVNFGIDLFGSDNMGVFCYTFPQTIIFALTIGYGMYCLKKWKSPIWFRMVILLFFALNPVMVNYAYMLIKDTSYSIVMFWFVMLLMDFITSNERFKWYKWVFLGFSALFVCMLRNNGIYLVLLSLPFLIIFSKKYRLKMLLSVGSAAAVFLIFDLSIVPTLGIGDGDIAEMLSVPFQQTARYVGYYDDEIPEDEKQVIASVLNYDRLKTDYKPETSDPVKIWYKRLTKGDNSNLVPYFKVWFKEFLNHPLAYFEATANGTFGYFYPILRLRGWGIFVNPTDFYVVKGDVNFTLSENTLWFRSATEDFTALLAKTPGISLLFTTAFWDWILLGASLFVIAAKKYKLLIALIPAWISFAVCLVGPVNAHPRYLLQNICALPFILAWIWFMIKSKDSSENTDADNLSDYDEATENG